MREGKGRSDTKTNAECLSVRATAHIVFFFQSRRINIYVAILHISNTIRIYGP